MDGYEVEFTVRGKIKVRSNTKEDALHIAHSLVQDRMDFNPEDVEMLGCRRV